MYAPLTSKTPASCERITDLGSENHLAIRGSHYMSLAGENRRSPLVWSYRDSFVRLCSKALRRDSRLPFPTNQYEHVSNNSTSNFKLSIPKLSYPGNSETSQTMTGLVPVHSINGAFGRQDLPKLHQGSQGICQVKQRPGAENHVEAPSSGSGEPGPWSQGFQGLGKTSRWLVSYERFPRWVMKICESSWKVRNMLGFPTVQLHYIQQYPTCLFQLGVPNFWTVALKHHGLKRPVALANKVCSFAGNQVLRHQKDAWKVCN